MLRSSERDQTKTPIGYECPVSAWLEIVSNERVEGRSPSGSCSTDAACKHVPVCPHQVWGLRVRGNQTCVCAAPTAARATPP
ncbi:unnamed protein product [Ixodes persulcatus]